MFYTPPVRNAVEARFVGFAPHDGGTWHAYPTQGNIYSEPRMCTRYVNAYNRYYPTPTASNNSRMDREGFEVTLDMRNFTVDEITVKVVNGFLVIEGKHAEKRDENGYVTRHMVRRYALPDTCNSDSVTSRMCGDGLLTIFAPKRAEMVRGERIVPILNMPTHPQPMEAGHYKSLS